MSYLWWAIGIAALLTGGWYAFNSYIYAEKQGDEAGNGASTSAEERHMDIEAYVRTSISSLSPIKEQLGGTFYVTEIETKDGTGVVSYEDGHNAYTADFAYTIEEDGRPVVTSFAVRE